MRHLRPIFVSASFLLFQACQALPPSTLNPAAVDCDQVRTGLASLETELASCQTDADCQYVRRNGDTHELELVPRDTSTQYSGGGCVDRAPIVANAATFSEQKDGLTSLVEAANTTCAPEIECGAIQLVRTDPPPICTQNRCAAAPLTPP